MRIIIMLLPWLELFTLIELGIKTSALSAVGYVFVTAAIGVAVLQRQGRGMLERLRQGQNGSFSGPEFLLDDMAMGFAGLLLIFPGMITDLVAIMVAIGPLRRRLVRVFPGSKLPQGKVDRNAGSHATIEGEYHRIDDERFM